jgi:uncharacterized protein (DUF4415 family)
MKPVQYFKDEYLKESKKMTPDQILKFLDDYKNLINETKKEKTKLISIKIKPSLLNTFKEKCKTTNKPYQTKIKELMKNWILN